MSAAWTIAAATLREALHSRVPWLVVLAAAAALGISRFAGALALTESEDIALALLAAMLRAFGVFLTALFLVSSIAREAQDKGREMLLALDLSRSTYLFGKLSGFASVAAVLALLSGALVCAYAPIEQALLWSASLLLELWIVAAFSLLCALGFSQVLPALFACGAFYLLARTISSMQLLGDGLLGQCIEALAALLPHLDAFARTEWLVYQNGSLAELGPQAMQALIYTSLLGMAGCFDLHKKEI
ncbi:MAG: ABC transporter permease [Pseudomonadota bacterium]